MILENLNGKTIRKCTEVSRGHYKYRGLLIEFVDGTTIEINGNSSADIEYTIHKRKPDGTLPETGTGMGTI